MGEKTVMGKMIKIVFVICASMALCFAQVADTTKAPEPKNHQDNEYSIPKPISLPTEVKPKSPTNWSKIKDLFL